MKVKFFILFCFLLPLMAFQFGNQLIKSNICNLEFSVPENWKFENLKAEWYNLDEENEFKTMDKQMDKMLNGFDVFQCTSPTIKDQRTIGFFIYKDNTLNLNDIDFYSIKFQTKGNGQKFVINGIDWTSIVKSEKPEGFENYNIYQFTARIKKINILIFAKYPLSMDENLEDKEIKSILGTFKLN